MAEKFKIDEMKTNMIQYNKRKIQYQNKRVNKIKWIESDE